MISRETSIENFGRISINNVFRLLYLFCIRLDGTVINNYTEKADANNIRTMQQAGETRS